MRKFKVGDIVLVEAQLASADDDIQEDALGSVGMVLATNADKHYPIAVEGCGGAYLARDVYGDYYHPEELCLLDSVE